MMNETQAIPTSYKCADCRADIPEQKNPPPDGVLLRCAKCFSKHLKATNGHKPPQDAKARKTKPINEEDSSGICRGGCGNRVSGEFTCAACRKKTGTPSAADILAQLAAEKKATEAAVEESEKLEEAEAEAEERMDYPDLVVDVDAICPVGTIYREIVEDACRGGELTGNKPWAIPAALVLESVLAIASAIPEEDVMLEERINRFSCNLALSRAGKGVSYKRAGAALAVGEWPNNSEWIMYKPAGHSKMVSLLGDSRGMKTKENPDPAPQPGPTHIMAYTPDFSTVYKSAKSESSHMSETWTEFYDHNLHFTHERSSDRKILMDCRTSWGTALAMGEDRIDLGKFEAVFGCESNNGLLQRTAFAFFEGRIEPKDVDEWTPKNRTSYLYTLRHHKVVGWETGVRERFRDTPTDPFPGGGQMFKKTLIVMACINLHTKVTNQDFDAALAWLSNQEKVRKAIAVPSRADDDMQAIFNEKVVRRIRVADIKLGKKGIPWDKRWVGVKRLSEHDGWSLKGCRLGLARTMEALSDYGEVRLLLDEESKSGNDWRKARATHWNWKHCWCGEHHQERIGTT
jgi:DNA-directed RNA polymerase subunit RPC12/RpoP